MIKKPILLETLFQWSYTDFGDVVSSSKSRGRQWQHCRNCAIFDHVTEQPWTYPIWSMCWWNSQPQLWQLQQWCIGWGHQNKWLAALGTCQRSAKLLPEQQSWWGPFWDTPEGDQCWTGAALFCPGTKLGSGTSAGSQPLSHSVTNHLPPTFPLPPNTSYPPLFPFPSLAFPHPNAGISQTAHLIALQGAWQCGEATAIPCIRLPFSLDVSDMEHLPHPWVGTRNFFAQMGAQDCVSSMSCNPHPIAMPLCVGLGTCLGLICNRCLWKLRRHDSATAGDGICTAKGETSGKMKTSVSFHTEIKIKTFMASLPMLEPVRKLLYILNIDAADQS